ncbi:hypothetical protein JYT29_00125 [Nitrospina gracilis]|nr:hypothetical protein [Nitrospina gracilis]
MFHQSPRFAGSLTGGVLAILGTFLMLIPLVYLVIKRVKRINRWMTRWASMRTLLAWHIYAGVLGPILAIMHTGHKFESPLGILLTAMTLIVVFSGFIGRYLMKKIRTEIKEKKSLLNQLNEEYEKTMLQLRTCCADQVELIQPYTGIFSRLLGNMFFSASSAIGDINATSKKAFQLTDSIADVEYAIKTHESFKQAFSAWLKIHILLSGILYVLLIMHVWGAIHFGLRWFS